MVGIYKVHLKSQPKKIYIVGSANIESYVSTLDGNYIFTLIWPCNKLDLKHYEVHFREKLGLTGIPEKAAKETEDIKPPEAIEIPESKVEYETAVIPEPQVEHAVLKALVKKTVRKPRKKKK